MKTACFLLLALLSAGTVHAQGRLSFANTTTTRLYTNDGVGNFGLMSGVNAYRIGLYAGPSGSAENDLQLIGTATNQSGAFVGRFNGGNPFYLPNGYPSGTELAFQVRVWSFFAGMSYEEASAYSGPCFLGRTALGYLTPTDSPFPPPFLFGTGPGQLSGLQVPPSGGQFASLAVETAVPEPSALVLGAFGLLMLLSLRRRGR